MSDVSVLAGPAIRRVRRQAQLTQAAMAARLGISPSYLNLIERNQRPLTARLMLALAEQFDFDPRHLRHDEAVGGVDGLRRRLADERFSDLTIDRDEVAEWLAAAPQAAQAFARLYDAAAPSAAPVARDALSLVRQEVERWRNHFADLDAAAEVLGDELRLSNPDIGAALTERLRQKHQIAVRILPVDVMTDALRRLDLHARQLQLSELLDAPRRNFQIAVQIALLEQRDAIAAIANGAQFADRAAWRLFRRHLTHYFAAAVLMPYGRFLRACETTGYNLSVLQRRFSVTFEQLAHRLTTLQRVGQRGLPFAMARIDRAGQFSKRFAGASAAPMLSAEGVCPLWGAFDAFINHFRLVIQNTEFKDEVLNTSRYISIAQTAGASAASGDSGPFHAVVLTLEARLASQLTWLPAHVASGAEWVRTGPGCSACQRMECLQRSAPPRGATLEFDERVRAMTPFRFAG